MFVSRRLEVRRRIYKYEAASPPYLMNSKCSIVYLNNVYNMHGDARNDDAAHHHVVRVDLKDLRVEPALVPVPHLDLHAVRGGEHQEESTSR